MTDTPPSDPDAANAPAAGTAMARSDGAATRGGGTAAPIPFIDLAAQQARIRAGVEAGIARVLDHGRYVMGPEIDELESRLSAFCGVPHAVACGSGTDALALPLMAWGLRPGDAVFCPAHTFTATAEVVAWLGASPVFVDVDPGTQCMDPASLDRAIAQTRAEGALRPRAVIAVDLFGQIADYEPIRGLCDAHGLKLVSDAAQGFGATRDGRHSGAWADVVATSFFPAKPLGCYGDGGAVMVHDAELDEALRSLRNHGANADDRYDNIRIGMNGRMDSIQAAVLLEKLTIFPDEIDARNRVAARYSETLGDIVEVPVVPEGTRPTWAQYTVVLPEAGLRDGVMAALRGRGVPSAIYYPIPMHRQTAYAHYPVEGGRLPVTEDLAARVLSLPMHPYLGEADIERVTDALRAALA